MNPPFPQAPAERHRRDTPLLRDHQRQTEFLTQCLRYDDTAESRELAEAIARIQQDERRAERGLRWMAGLVGLAITGLCYSAVFGAYYPENMLGFTMNFITQAFGVLGLISTICLLTFAYLGGVYRKELNERRTKCRQLITATMEARLGQPASQINNSPPGLNQTPKAEMAVHLPPLQGRETVSFLNSSAAVGLHPIVTARPGA